MTSNNESVRLLKMKIKKPQNIDASYATMYEGEDSKYEDAIKLEENHHEEDYDEKEEHDEVSEEGDVPDMTVEEALPPPPKLIEEGLTAAEEMNIDEEKIEGEDDLDTSITSSTYNNEDKAEIYVHGMPLSNESWSERNEGENELDASVNNVEFKYVQDMPSSSETWSERIDIFNGSKYTMEAVPESMLPQQHLLDQNEPADEEDEKELQVIDTFIDEEHGDDIDEAVLTAESERQESEEDEQGDEEAVEDNEEVEKEGDDNKEEEGSDEVEMVEEEVEEQGNEKELEDTPEGDEDEKQQQQDIVAMKAGKAYGAPDITPELVSWCKNMKWHPNKGFNHCSNSMDIPQAGVEDEKFQQMFFFDTLVECCQKFFHSDECEHEDMCVALNVLGEVEGVAFERQADGELEDEVPADEGQPGDGTGEEAAEEGEEEEEEVANEEEEGEEASDANEEEEGEETSDESNNKSSSTEGQGVQIDETNESTNWEGFDEEMSHQSVKREPEQPSSSVEAHDLSDAQGKDDYEGDGFGTMKYKLLRGKGEGGKRSANPFTTLGSGVSIAAILLILSCCCLCYRRYRRRRYALSKRPNRGNYAALGRDDFFNGTFSDDISYGSYGKNSDDDVSVESYGSDDGGHQTNLEMGGFHELDANGGLTLEEING